MVLSAEVDIAAGTIGVQLMFKLQDMLRFTESQVKKMAENAVENQKKQINSGMAADNTQFEQYSEAYAKRKKGGRRSPVTLKDTGKMLNAFDVQRVTVRKNQEIQFLYGIKKNKQGTKLFNHNEGLDGMPPRPVALKQQLGHITENGIVEDFVDIINENLSRMRKTREIVNI